jgi:hypothetical protein
MQTAMEDGSAFVASIGGPLDDIRADHAQDGRLQSPEMKAVAQVRRTTGDGFVISYQPFKRSAP